MGMHAMLLYPEKALLWIDLAGILKSGDGGERYFRRSAFLGFRRHQRFISIQSGPHAGFSCHIGHYSLQPVDITVR